MLEGAFGYLYGSIKQLFILPDNVLLTKKTLGLRNTIPKRIESIRCLDFRPTFNQHKEPSWTRNQH